MVIVQALTLSHARLLDVSKVVRGDQELAGGKVASDLDQ